jgi:hypothetical protein
MGNGFAKQQAHREKVLKAIPHISSSLLQTGDILLIRDPRPTEIGHIHPEIVQNIMGMTMGRDMAGDHSNIAGWTSVVVVVETPLVMPGAKRVGGIGQGADAPERPHRGTTGLGMNVDPDNFDIESKGDAPQGFGLAAAAAASARAKKQPRARSNKSKAKTKGIDPRRRTRTRLSVSGSFAADPHLYILEATAEGLQAVLLEERLEQWQLRR